MASGEDLTILLDDSEATANVSRSLRKEGHQILGLKSISDGVWQIIVKKGLGRAQEIGCRISINTRRRRFEIKACSYIVMALYFYVN
jgi:hypothetical protein